MIIFWHAFLAAIFVAICLGMFATFLRGPLLHVFIVFRCHAFLFVVIFWLPYLWQFVLAIRPIFLSDFLPSISACHVCGGHLRPGGHYIPTPSSSCHRERSSTWKDGKEKENCKKNQKENFMKDFTENCTRDCTQNRTRWNSERELHDHVEKSFIPKKGWKLD